MYNLKYRIYHTNNLLINTVLNEDNGKQLNTIVFDRIRLFSHLTNES